MGTRSFFWLYRATAPTARAQAIQVVNMAHAVAVRGHEVELAVDPAGDVAAADVLRFYGLEPVPTLRLFVLPRSRTLGSIVYRARISAFVARNLGSGILYARSKRHAKEALDRLGKRFRLVVEAHEVDSRQAEERGQDPTAFRKLEEAVFSRADAVVANAPGTLALLRETHALPPAVALHNASHESRFRKPGRGEGIGYVGSVRDEKDLATLARAAAQLPWPVSVVGADRRVGSDGNLRIEGPIPHRDVPDRLAGFRVLVLPLSKGLFGERLTSPLKLWDYLASGVPFVGADLPSLRDAAPGAFVPYEPGDADSLAAAIRALYDDEALRARVLAAARPRTWADRAAELDAFLDGVWP